MEIRKKLTLQFVAIVGLILFFALILIYLLFSRYRHEEFYDRLEKKAIAVAQMLIDIDEVDVELLRKIEQNNPTSLPNEIIRIYDFRNKLIYSSDFDNVISIPKPLLKEIRLDQQVKFKQNDFEVLGLFYTGRFDRFVVLAAAKDIYGFQKIRNLKIILLVVFFSSLGIVYLGGWIFSARSLHPMAKVVSQVNQIGVDNLDARVDEGNGTDEIARMAKTFNQMLMRIENAFTMQKNFISNASHELRTPLTAMQGNLEVALMKERPVLEYRNTLILIHEEIRNLTRLTNNLLMLAKTDTDISKSGFNVLRIDEIIWQVVSDLKRRNANYEINVSFDQHLDEAYFFQVYGDELLLRSAFINLAENGCKYSNEEQIALNVSSDGHFLSLVFKDAGIGIDSGELDKIFDPFYRAKNAFTRKGVGIGLSIVKRIILLHNGKVKVNSTPGVGSEFTVILPIFKD